MLQKVAFRTKSDKERTAKSLLYPSFNIATASQMYSDATGEPQAKVQEKLIAGTLVAGDVFNAICTKYNEMQAELAALKSKK